MNQNVTSIETTHSEPPQATYEHEPPYTVVGSLGRGKSGPYQPLSNSLEKFPNRAWRRKHRKNK